MTESIRQRMHHRAKPQLAPGVGGGSHIDPPPSYLYALEQGQRNDGMVNVDPGSRLVKSLSLFVPDWKFPDGPEASLPAVPGLEAPPAYSPLAPTSDSANADEVWSLPLNIVIQVVGSRGDVQPFTALGNELQRYGHRVRLATHNVFEAFVTSSNLEFFPIGGDPAELMAYMVKNLGLLPGMKTLLSEEIGTKRDMVASILDGCWKSCIEPDRKTGRPFVADAIIANPPSFAHVHCAQALGIPVHVMFTMPWSSTRFFRHPLANIKDSQQINEATRQTLNWVSFAFVEWMTWQGIGDLVNNWRRTLDLESVPFTEGPLLAEKLQIPTTYRWSPALIPTPVDWPDFIDVCGFFFREEPQYAPPPELAKFLEEGPPPIYVGFGSIVIDDPERLTEMILGAAEAIGARLIVSRGWSKLGASRHSSDRVIFIDDCPHEWLFKHVAVVVHHGGAGTAACGLRLAKPTFIVPFFGDQFFWGEMVARAGAGPNAIRHKDLNLENLSEALNYCMSPEASRAALAISDKMKGDSGVKAAARSFHKHLPAEKMRCQVADDKVATWAYFSRCEQMLLSDFAVEILAQGMRNAPRLYGGKVANHGPVTTDWKSGLVVSGKNLGNGIGQGFAGVVQEPVRGAQQGGAVGAIKGVGRGLLGLGTGVSAAAMGIVAYPGWGIYQSINRSLHTKTRNRIVAARKAEADDVIGRIKDPDVERRVLDRFDAFFR
ncbi:glycosyltransferase family 1 protein [Diaporthe eres]|nr:glycosyltransferase family 1 protein [Diaporthe eres]